MNPQYRSELQQHRGLLLMCCLMASMALIPLISRPFSLYVTSWRAEFGWTQGQISLAFSILGAVYAFSAPVIGALADRFPVRQVIRICGLFYALALLSITLSEGHLSRFYASFALLGFCGVGVSVLTYSKLLAQAFTSQLGTALGCLTGTIALSAIATPPISQAILERYGWRACWAFWAAVAFAILIPLSSLLPNDSKRVGRIALLEKPSIYLRTRAFWLLAALAMLLGLGSDAIVPHLSVIAREQSAMTPASAAFAIAIYGIGSLVGRLSGGWLLDRWPPDYVIALCIGTSAAGLILLLLANAELLFPACFLLGYSSGSEMDIIPYAIKLSFGTERMGQIIGLVQGPAVAVSAFMIALTGKSYDVFESFGPVTLLLLTTCLPAAILTVLWARQSRTAVAAPSRRRDLSEPPSGEDASVQ